MRAFAFLLVLVALFGPARANAAAPPFSGVLGTNAQVKMRLTVPESHGAIAVVYENPHWRLGLVKLVKAHYELLFDRELSGAPADLTAPTGEDVFRVLDKFPGSRQEELYAFVLAGSKVHSAISGASDGQTTAVDGFVQHTDGFTLRSPDASHVGETPYRFTTRYVWNGTVYAPGKTVREPDYPKDKYPASSAWVTTSSGDTILIELSVAADEASREQGLMGVTNLDPDAGMIFEWGGEADDSFWMENTPIDLSIAFLGKDGTVQEIQDMQAETTTIHTPARPYWYAIEANVGFFKSNGIVVGDRFHLPPQQ